MPNPEASALEAYWRFFEGTNSRDVRRFIDALNFPHVRISARGHADRVPDAQTHMDRVSFDALIATGWDHTVGMAPEVLDVTSRKVHIKGGWTRFTRDEEPIIGNTVMYIATLLEGHWWASSPASAPIPKSFGETRRMIGSTAISTLNAMPPKPRAS